MRERVDVLRLLARLGIEYRTEGSELWARCPAHDDARPSWSINSFTGAHHCFSCGWGGGAADLVLRVLDAGALAWTPRDAWDWMRDQGLMVGENASLDVELYLVEARRRGGFVLPRGLVVAPFDQWPTPAARYVEKRRIADWQLRRWGVGFAVDGRLAGRIVFPVHDAAGRPVSYSARSFTGSGPRYLTPHDLERADEAAIFGERYWPSHGNRRRIVVVEGAIKALAVERAIGGPVGGLLGATRAQSPRIVSKLATFGEVVVLTDDDPAGDAAAEELVGALVRHAEVRRVKMRGAPVDDAEPEAIEQTVLR